MKVAITLTEEVVEFLRGIMDQNGDLAADGVEFTAEDYAGQIETLLEQMAETVGIERAVTAKSPDKEKVYWNLEKPSLRNYRFNGQVDYKRGFMCGDVQKITPYDDADYWWARVNENGLIEFIHDGRIQDKMQMHTYDEEDYEDINDYFNDMIESAATKLVQLNKNIEPIIIHN